MSDQNRNPNTAKRIKSTMYTWIIVGVLTISALCTADSPPSLTIIHDDVEEIKAGDNVTIRCVISELNTVQAVRLVRKVGDKQREMVTNCGKEDSFSNLDRYVVEPCGADFDEGQKTTTVNVQIRGVRAEDGGDIGCKKLGEGGVFEFVTLDVNVPLSRMSIVYLDGGNVVELEEGATKITLTEDQGEVLLGCRVAVDNSAIGPTVDFGFSDFDVGSLISESPANKSEDLVDGLLVASYSKQYQYRSSTADVRLNGQILTCAATMRGYETVSRSVEIEVRYKPKIRCDADHYNPSTSAQVRLDCSAHMHPSPESHSWSWDNDGNETSITPQDSADNYHAEHTPQQGDWHQFSLVIKNVSSEDYRLYKLDVQNSEGNAQHHIQLHEVIVNTESPLPTSSSAAKVIENTSRPSVNDNNGGEENGSAPLAFCTRTLTLIMFVIIIAMLS